MSASFDRDDDVPRTIQEESGGHMKAPKEYVRREKFEKLIQLQGKVQFSAGWKTLRTGWERTYHSYR